MNTLSSPPSANRVPSCAATLTAVVCATILLSCGQQAQSPPARPASSATVTKAAYQPLVGRWQRTDGDYMIEVRGIEASGRAEVAYFNPRPINVARAEASGEGGNMRLTIELRDAGYPGCIYKLAFDKAKDQLVGTYFQAAQNETYDIA
ncbi:MAG: hypothetical protein N2689_16515, partial [Verrucomicrobiae bacterium]|nr:hypothetical protein [Verrucomicrobiae bacterium]